MDEAVIVPARGAPVQTTGIGQSACRQEGEGRARRAYLFRVSLEALCLVG